MQVSKSPWVLGLAAVCIVCVTVLVYRGTIGWQEWTGAVVLLGLPSIFAKRPTPPPPPPPPPPPSASDGTKEAKTSEDEVPVTLAASSTSETSEKKGS